MTRRAVFLDRDGTINRAPAPHEYVTSPSAFELLEGVAAGMARLATAGWTLIVVSNQRGVALGTVDEQTLSATEEIIQSALAPSGHQVAAFYYCLHDLPERCGCRKPEPGLLLRAARDHDLALSESWMIGDADSDVKAGAAAGCRTIRLGVDVATLPMAAERILALEHAPH